MKKRSVILVMIMAMLVFSFACKDSGDATNTVAPEQQTSGTGTVSGSLSANAQITLNQSDGTAQSTSTTPETPEYEFNNVPTGETTIVYNSNGQQTTQTVQVNSGETTQVNPFGSTQELLNSLKGQVFEVINNGWSTTVDDISANPLGEPFYTREINVPQRSFEEGFPGITDRFEWFGVVYEGKIKAPQTGTYIFQITSDDGSVLYINGQKVVDNDKVHAPKTVTGVVNLNEGQIYDIKVKYFQGPRYYIALVVKVQLPNGEMQLFNMSNFATH